MGTNMEARKRYGVVTTWNDDCTVRIGSHIEEMPDGIYCLVSENKRLREALSSIRGVEKLVQSIRTLTKAETEILNIAETALKEASDQ